VLLEPKILEDLKYVRASICTPKGTIDVNWEKLEDSVKLVVVLPVNVEGELRIPKLYTPLVVEEDDRVIWSNSTWIEKVDGVYSVKEELDLLSFTLGSGRFLFNIKAK